MYISKKIFGKVILAVGIGMILGGGIRFALDKGSNEKMVFSDGRIFTVVCDAGHGAPDGGAVGIDGTPEKDINLAIVLKIQEVLEAEGIRVILTRTGDDGLHDGTGTIRSMKLADMNKRLEIINNSDADLFLSVHMNAFTDKSAEGIHIFYGKKYEGIKPLAEAIMKNVTAVTGATAHEVKVAAESLYLIKNAKPPCILAECGFLSNPDEVKKLKDEEYQSKLAWAISRSIAEYCFN